MKKITLIKMEGCMYCAQVLAAIKEVKADYPEFKQMLAPKILRANIITCRVCLLTAKNFMKPIPTKLTETASLASRKFFVRQCR